MAETVLVRRLGASKARLWAEFLGLYVAAPVAMAVFLPPALMFPVLFLFTSLGVILLHVTEGFQWHDLTRNLRKVDWRAVAGFAAVTAAVAAWVVLTRAPEAFLALPKYQPALLLMIVLLYPILSALPQEVVFRPLFFRRYGALLPGLKPAMVLNAGVFSLAHLMYWSWVVAVMTFFGGLAFAWAYEARRSFAMAVVLHSVAGWILFALGLGVWFYSGNVQRPF